MRPLKSFIALAASLYLRVAGAVSPTVDLTYSKYVGTALSNGVSQWLGIRYAAPPVGQLRFKAPQDPLYNSETQYATEVRKMKTRLRDINLTLDIAWEVLPRDGRCPQ